MPFCELEITALPPHLRIIQRPSTIGEHLKKRRFQLRLLQSDVSKILDVCEDTISGWENERSEPYIHYYPTIISFLGYSPFDIDTSTLGGRIKKYRIENGLSQEELAYMLRVNESTVFGWEKNAHNPSINKLKLLEELMCQKELSI